MTDAQTFPAAHDPDRDNNKEESPPGGTSQTDEQSGQEPQSEPLPPTEARPSPWFARSVTMASATQRVFARPKVRLSVLGGVLLLLAAFVVTGSAWTAPLAIVGILALVVAWFGSRLDGRLVLEWGESGVSFELKADITAPQHPIQHVKSLAIQRRLDAVSDDALVIESTATTVEIDVAELKALIALAEAA
jgi:hypothetical protein